MYRVPAAPGRGRFRTPQRLTFGSHHVQLTLVTLVFALVACSPGDQAGGTPQRDDFGSPVPTGQEPVRRIVSLNPTTTELLYAIGAGDRIVGRSQWDATPEEVLAVPDVGPGLRPNVEAILEARPDLVVLYASADNRAAARRIEEAGVETIALRIDRVADLRRAAGILGSALHTEARAAGVIDSVERTLARVREATAGKPRVSVFWHVWDDPLITIGGGSFMTELVEIAGGRNIFADLPQPSAQVSLEEVIRRDPQVILASPRGAARIAADPAWRSLRAVRERRIFTVDTLLVSRPSVRLGEAARSLALLLHPGSLR